MMPKKSLTKSVKGMVMPTPRLAPSNVSMSQETLEHMRQCEAREWISRYKRKTIELGSGNAQLWWAKVKSDIEKRRGYEAMLDLVNRMKQERENGKSRTD
jgi:hypothetical protein